MDLRSCTCDQADRPPDCQHHYAASVCQATYRFGVERELFLDRMTYGTSWSKIVNGYEVRIDPRDVVVRLRWYVRLWQWLRWRIWGPRRVTVSAEAAK